MMDAMPTPSQTPGVNPTVLQACALSVGYGPIPVVKELDLALGAGEIVALLGANGAGKTTTLMAISGVIRAAAGSVHFRGQSLAGLRPEDIVKLGRSMRTRTTHLFEGIFEPAAKRPADPAVPPAEPKPEEPAVPAKPKVE